MLKPLLVGGAVFAAVIAFGIPASAKGRTTFVVSGGDLKHSVSFDSQRLDSVRGTWWHPESHTPILEGLRYRLRQYDAGNPSVATEWIYLPDASGALPTGTLASRGFA